MMVATGLLTARLLLAAVFVVAGAGKLADLQGTAEAVRALGGPSRGARGTAVALTVGELAVAMGLVVSATAWWAALGALGLLALLTVVVAAGLRRGDAPACHCFGGLRAARIGPATMARNLLLLAVAAVVVAHGSSDTGASATRWVTRLGEPGWIAFAGALTAGTLLVLGGWLTTELLRRAGRLLTRVDQLEQALADAGLQVPPDAHASAAVPGGGDPAPAFTLPDLDGRRVALTDLLALGRGVMLVFASASCHPCRVVLRSLAERPDDAEPHVVVIGEGSAQQWRALPAQLRPALILLQSTHEVADRYGAQVTPTAVTISADGVLTAPPALGASAVRELLKAAADRRAPMVAPRLAAHGAVR